VSHAYSERAALHAPEASAGRRLTSQWRELTFRDVVAFWAPALIAFQLHIGGNYFVPEVIVFAYLPFLLIDQGRRRLTRAEGAVIGFGLAWLWSQVITDLSRGSAFADYSRGWSKIAFSLGTFVALSLLIGDNRRRLVLFAAGLVVGLLIQYKHNPLVYAATQPWKFGIGFPITLALVILACHRFVYRVPLLSPLILAGAAGLNLVKEYRSLAGICFLTGAYVLLQQRTRARSGRAVTATPGRVVAVIAVGGVLVFGFIGLYGYTANRGLLGGAAAQEYQHQSAGKFGVLLGGRPQTLVEAQAVFDSPVIGHGSWAKNSKYTYGLLRAMQRSGYTPTSGDVYGILHSNTIPTHSYLFGSWVEAGLLGAVFWIAIVVLACQVLFGLYRIRDPLTPLFAFIIVDLLWAVAFSPYGSQDRFIAPFMLVVVLYVRRRLAEASGTGARAGLDERPTAA
jgi:hypothetical protein